MVTAFDANIKKKPTSILTPGCESHTPYQVYGIQNIGYKTRDMVISLLSFDVS